MALMMAADRARGALIVPITSTEVPVSNTASVFDVSHPGNIYSLGPGTSLNPGFDIRDLFGGSFGNGSEQNDVIFDDFQPPGTVDAVDITLAAPISLTGFNLYLEESNPRRFSKRQ